MKKYDESLEEAAEALEIDIDDAIEAMEGPRVSASIDAAVSDDPSRDGQHALIPDPGAPDPADVVVESNTDLDAALEELTSQQRKIVEMRHGLGGPVMSRNDVADELGVGAKVVQEEHSVALTKIKRLLLKWAAERTGMEEEEAAVKAVFEAFADDEEEDPYVRGV